MGSIFLPCCRPRSRSRRFAEALEAGLVIFSEHATRAARDDGVTPLQVFEVIERGLPVQKDSPGHQSRVSGISFEGRAGGSRKVRVKVSHSEGY